MGLMVIITQMKRKNYLLNYRLSEKILPMIKMRSPGLANTTAMRSIQLLIYKRKTQSISFSARPRIDSSILFLGLKIKLLLLELDQGLIT
jgi:hypothetical protein